MLIQLKEFQLFNITNIEIVNCLKKNFIETILAIELLLVKVSFILSEFALIKDLQLFFEVTDQIFFFERILDLFGNFVVKEFNWGHKLFILNLQTDNFESS